ncbi:hypothetical protein [Baekduia sp. Peel2402]|uniref:hypothetical protein n=1 Tax=Baekduia sp. Peel2402 TaxID=3458296 RepID=UPI00403E8170
MDLCAAIDDFAAGPWGAATRDRWAAAGLCCRASLALFAHLEQRGLADGVRVVRFTFGKPQADRNPHANHWVLEIAGEAIDVTAAQFDHLPGIRRSPIADEAVRWELATVIDPDDPPADERPDPGLRLHGIVPRWRDVLGAGPPGVIPDWPYPCETLDPRSPWHRRAVIPGA